MLIFSCINFTSSQTPFKLSISETAFFISEVHSQITDSKAYGLFVGKWDYDLHGSYFILNEFS
jgi:hypothetical protein